MDVRSIGQQIRKYRIAQNLRQEDLAEKVGLSANYMGMVERGEKTPSLETFVHIANALGVSADMLLMDVINQGFAIKSTLLAERLEKLDPSERKRILDVIDTLTRHSS